MNREFPDFHALRHRIADYPDAMIHEFALDALARLRELVQVGDVELLWIIESYERRRPKVVGVTVDDHTTVREAWG
ncbi:MAG: hypothetical protein N3D71_01190 [Burkholderiaceae bacterium]|nr:hypothetical protein [Burkholderiaceae bacterium]